MSHHVMASPPDTRPDADDADGLDITLPFEPRSLERQLAERVSINAKALRTSETPQGVDPLVRAGMAENSELTILLLSKLGKLESDIREIRSREYRATEVLIHERMSQVGLQEEVTRTDLFLKKNRAEQWGKLVTKILAIVFTPPGLWALWEWLQRLTGGSGTPPG